MSMKHWNCFRARATLLFVLIFFPRAANPQTSDTAPKVLTLEDAVDYALQNYPAVRASLEQVSAARAGVTLARTQYLPQLNGVYQDSRATQNQVPGHLAADANHSNGGRARLVLRVDRVIWGSQAAALFSWEPLDFGLRSAKVGQARSRRRKVAGRPGSDAAPGRDGGWKLFSACRGKPASVTGGAGQC